MNKRRVIGKSVGAPSVLDKSDDQFLVDCLRRRDRSNEGMGRGELADMVQDLNPNIDRKTALRKTDRVRHANKAVLTGIVSAQASTTKRTAITVPQQARWHKVSSPHPRTAALTLCLSTLN